jgi:hypothetical protein
MPWLLAIAEDEYDLADLWLATWKARSEEGAEGAPCGTTIFQYLPFDPRDQSWESWFVRRWARVPLLTPPSATRSTGASGERAAPEPHGCWDSKTHATRAATSDSSGGDSVDDDSAGQREVLHGWDEGRPWLG